MMTSLRYSFLGIFLFFMVSSARAQYVTIPDANFRTYLETNYPTCMNGGMLDTTCNRVVTATGMFLLYQNISDLTGIQYFDGLLTLSCGANQLTSLPPLPATLTILECGANQLTSLPTLPPSLGRLNCSFNKLTTLPTLPNSLYNLYCNDNKLTSLPELPARPTAHPCMCDELRCDNNLLTELPTLPQYLGLLNCNNNKITVLPTLPTQLRQLYCNNNKLTNLPTLPTILGGLDCEGNQLTSLPSLPNYLTSLSCNNNQLTCLPILPNSLTSLSASNNQITCLPNIPVNPYNFVSDIGTTTCDPFNPNGCIVYPILSGTVFIDDNGDNIKDVNEKPYANATIVIQPGNYLVTTDSLGFYEMHMEVGDYTITPKSTLYRTFAPSSRTVNLNTYGQINTNNNFVFQVTNNIIDLGITVTPLHAARPGREITYLISYKNPGTLPSDGSLAFHYEETLSFIASSLTPSSNNGNILGWDFTNLKPDQHNYIWVTFTIPSTATLGDILHSLATINPTTSDHSPADNSDELEQIVTSSFDPNYKEVSPASDITTDQVAAQERFTYIVHFQNTGNDTAFVITIKDTISSNFEILEIETIAASHDYVFRMKDGAAVWTFNDILLPDSTTNERLSHGFVKYRIIPKNTLMPGDEIKNTAHIFFDYNAPIVTNTTLNRVSMPTGMVKNTSLLMQLYPNPSKGIVNISTSATGAGSIRVSNADGKIVQNITTSDVSKGYQLDLSNEIKGLYIIQLISNEGMMTQKVIIS